MVALDNRFVGSDSVRLFLSLCVFAVLIALFGLSLRSTDILLAVDILIVFISLMFLAGIVLPDGVSSFKDRFTDEKWLLLFSLLYIIAILILAIRILLEGVFPGGLSLAVKISLIYSTLCSVRVLLAYMGSWALDHLSPAAILPVSFAIVIAFGSAMLLLPNATPSGNSIGVIDAVFTSTSATCVTGLIVRDTSADFTVFGQTIILILIQVGGLGIMTFVAFFALFLGHNAGLRESASLVQVMDSDFINDLKKIMGSIIGWTLTIESAGAFILYLVWDGQPVGWTMNFKIWQSVFHSVSAFCNAGFCLNPTLIDSSSGYFSDPTNLEAFAHVPGIAVTIGSLIVLGGIGFLILTSIGAHILHRMKTGTSMRMSVQVKLVLWITAILIVVGLGLFLVFEWNNSLAGMTFSQKISNAFLGSVTPRTAGFNTVPTSTLMPALQWFIIAFMFIGASPGGTGGGVKTSTIGVILEIMVRGMRNRAMAPSVQIVLRTTTVSGRIMPLGVLKLAPSTRTSSSETSGSR